jgi:glycine/D-amino acid oxidase-like deaminating enzyme
MRYKVIVIGAGMVGTSIAWHLQKNNSQVLLLDKKSPGLETSYGNAGLIQREAIHVHPDKNVTEQEDGYSLSLACRPTLSTRATTVLAVFCTILGPENRKRLAGSH